MMAGSNELSCQSHSTAKMVFKGGGKGREDEVISPSDVPETDPELIRPLPLLTLAPDKRVWKRLTLLRIFKSQLRL